MIDGVRVKKLRPICDERGFLMEILRRDDEMFLEFGQVYVTSAYPGVTKAWHYHKKQFDNFTALRGQVKLVLYDSREGSPTKGELMELFIGERNPILVRIPPGVYHGFKCIGTEEALMLNVPTETYNYDEPDEHRKPAHEEDGSEIPYDWSRKDR